jgi:hypothetical protein
MARLQKRIQESTEKIAQYKIDLVKSSGFAESAINTWLEAEKGCLAEWKKRFAAKRSALKKINADRGDAA